jgi:hypothetical protein
MSTSSGSEVKGSEEAANKSHIRYSTFGRTSGSMASTATTAVYSKEHIKALQEKAAEAH